MRFSGYDHRRHRYHQHQQDAYGPSRIQDYVQPSQVFYSHNESYQQQFSYNSSQNYVNSYNPPHRVPIPSEFTHTAGPGYTHMQNWQGLFRIGFEENQQRSNLGWGFTAADSMNSLGVGAAAALAAPSQLTKIAGNMDVAQRETNSSIGQSLYMGLGGRDDISFRGACWGQFNHSGPPLYHGRGCGWGGGGRQIPPHSSRPIDSQVASAPATAGATSVVQSAPSFSRKKPLPAPATAGATHSSRPTNSQVAFARANAGTTCVVQSAPSAPGQKPLPTPATAGATHSSRPTNSHVAHAGATIGAISVVQSAPSVPGQKPLPTPATARATSVVQSAPSVLGQKPLPTLAQVPSAPLQPPPQKGWCEICKVDCGSSAQLENHKNGKRHKKKLGTQAKLKILKAADGQQCEQLPTSQSNSAVHPEKIQELEKEECLAENIISEATVDNQQGDIKLQKDTGKNLDVPAEEPQGEPRENSVAWDLSSELKLGGRGVKYMKSDDGSRRPVEFPQPTQAPFICELCNVECYSESLFDDHMTGKRHKKNLKRASRGLQALYPPDANALANLIDFLVERGISDPQILSAQLVIRSALSQSQKPGISPPSGPLTTQIQVSASVAGSGSEPQRQHVLQTRVSEATAHVKSESSAGEANCI